VSLALEFQAKLFEATAESAHRGLAVCQGPSHKESFGVNPSSAKNEFISLAQFFL